MTKLEQLRDVIRLFAIGKGTRGEEEDLIIRKFCPSDRAGCIVCAELCCRDCWDREVEE